MGRVRVQVRTQDGNLVNPTIAPNKEALMKTVAAKFEAAREPAERARIQADEMIRRQQELQARQTQAQQKAAAKSGAQMSLPAMMGAGGMMYQPSDAVRKAQALPFGKEPGPR